MVWDLCQTKVRKRQPGTWDSLATKHSLSASGLPGCTRSAPTYRPPNHTLQFNPRMQQLLYLIESWLISYATFTSYKCIRYILFFTNQAFVREFDKTWTADSPDDLLWFCLLNVIFALGARFSINDDVDADIFFDRASQLLHPYILDVGSLRMVQILLLSGLYLQSTTRPNRCWSVVGLAVRIAQGLALHLNDHLQGVSIIEHELKKRIWFGCVALDTGLSMTYGRPSMITEATYETKLPSDIPDYCITETDIIPPPAHAPSPISFFIATCHLYRILRQILLRLYIERDAQKTQEYRRSTGHWLTCVLELGPKLRDWQANLPPYLKLGGRSPDILYTRQQHVLDARYQNVRILMFRPSLIYLGTGRANILPGQMPGLHESSTLSAALLCLEAATQQLDHLSHAIAQQTSGAMWYNIFYTYTATTILIAANSCPQLLEKCDLDLTKAWEQAMGIFDTYKQASLRAEHCQRKLTTLRDLMMLQGAPSLPPNISEPTSPIQFNLDSFAQTAIDQGVFMDGVSADFDMSAGWLQPILNDL